ncbi:MAG: preprotein translocase subunit SecE [Nitrospirae bacterium]|nr:preprotein translocase subunit SecE [Nitrospirota bacterium]
MADTIVHEGGDKVEEKAPIGERLAEKVKIGSLAQSLSPARIMETVRKSTQYFREVVIELKSVTWPGRKEVMLSTTVVVATCIAVMVILASLDAVFSRVMRWILE